MVKDRKQKNVWVTRLSAGIFLSPLDVRSTGLKQRLASQEAGEMPGHRGKVAACNSGSGLCGSILERG